MIDFLLPIRPYTFYLFYTTHLSFHPQAVRQSYNSHYILYPPTSKWWGRMNFFRDILVGDERRNFFHYVLRIFPSIHPFLSTIIFTRIVSNFVIVKVLTYFSAFFAENDTTKINIQSVLSTKYIYRINERRADEVEPSLGWTYTSTSRDRKGRNRKRRKTEGKIMNIYTNESVESIIDIRPWTSNRVCTMVTTVL